MFDAFAVTLREFAELVLIVGSLGAYLHKKGRRELFACIGWGLVLGLMLASALALVLIDASFGSAAEAALAAAMGCGMLVMAIGMGASAGNIRGRVQLFFDAWLERPGAGIAVIAFVALASFRESLEVAVFARAIHVRVGVSDTLTGMALGVAAAGLLWPAWRWLHMRAGLLMVFRLSALVLSLLSIQLLLHGVAQLLQTPMFASAGPGLVAAVEPFLAGGPRYGFLCAALMLGPVVLLMRGWWRRAGTVD
ncbi:hypothetical protein VLK31_21450 [Variovorax sp. H27-G14]|uniref:hypothetical protein n=1 Tax=Variovorax sp. H27-G14 TaxID=3111914 RepID=UPI0038FCDF82